MASHGVLRSFIINPNTFQIFFILSALLLSLALIIFLPNPAEKTHILSYGLFGFISIKDVTSKVQGTLKSLLLSLTYPLFIDMLDECFQWLLPYRVGKVRDAMINIRWIFIGISLFLRPNKQRLQKTI
ncbi:MAG: VanZ family protein [Candidatus Melainabacteria bacterium]|nr:VanZ family protein [Candidatus Melainabacteria bacterium]